MKTTLPSAPALPSRHHSGGRVEAVQDTFRLIEEMEYCPAPASGELEALGQPLSEIAPGVWVSGLPEFETPSHVLCELVPVPGQPGQYTLKPEPFPGYVRMCEDFGRRVGVIGLSDSTLRRLMWAGFIEHIRPAPGCLFVNIESMLGHFRRTRNDLTREASYWSAARRETWKETYEPI